MNRRSLTPRAAVLLVVTAVAVGVGYVAVTDRPAPGRAVATGEPEPMLRPPGRVATRGWVARYVAAPSDLLVRGQRWTSDARVARGGSYSTSSATVAGTTSPELFRQQRVGVQGYRIPVPKPGTYRVSVQSAELRWTRPDQRAFGLSIEGQVVTPRLDLVKTVGAGRALTRAYQTTVADGALDVAFTALVDKPTVASLSVELVATSRADGALVRLDDGQLPRGGLFGTTSFWKQPVHRAPVSPDSRSYVSELAEQVASRYGGIAAFNVQRYNTAYYTAAATEKRYDVAFQDCQKKGYTPRGLTGPGGQFSAVPIPPDVVPSAGTDASLSIYQPSTDTLWSFWKFSRQGNGFQACWGGRLENVSSSMGIFSGSFGVSAAGVAFEGGTIGIKDAQAGVIPHALVVHVPNLAGWRDISWPAVRSDGNGNGSIPMGTRFRLDPTVNVATLKLHPLARMVAKAAQDYGLIVTDTAGSVAVLTESGVETKRRTGADPWTALMNGTPSYNVMKGFPWDRLQALPRNYGKPGS